MMTKPRRWFTSDLHFSHWNILKYSNRPYKDVIEMDWDIIRRIKERLVPGDLLYILGDLTFGSPSHTNRLLEQIGPENPKFWILGNHDKGGKQKNHSHHFVWTRHYDEIELESNKVVLSHYPFESWNGMRRGSYHFHGHCHGNLKRELPRRFDVGVDCWDMNPVSWEELKEAAGEIDHSG